MAEQNLDFNIIAHTQGMEQIANLINRVGALEAETKKLASANKTLSTSTDSVIRNGVRYNNALDAQSKALRQNRQGTQQLGMQINDFATSVSTGASPLQAFNQQIGQVGIAMSLMGGTVGKVGAFLAGPWGAAVLIATMVLSPLIEAFFNTSKAAEELQKTEKAGREASINLLEAKAELDKALGKNTNNYKLAKKAAYEGALADLAAANAAVLASQVRVGIVKKESNLIKQSRAIGGVGGSFLAGVADLMGYGDVDAAVKESNDKINVYKDAQSALIRARAKLVDANKETAETSSSAVGRIGGAVKLPKMEKVKDRSLGSDPTEFEKMVRDLDIESLKEAERMLKELPVFIPPVTEEMQKIIDSTNELNDSFDNIGSAVANSFKGMITGAMSFRTAMKGIIGAVIDELFRLYVVQQVVGVVKGALGGLFGVPVLPGKAVGGSVTGNKPYMVGERGPELFVPGGNGTIIPNQNVRGGGGSPINISVDARGSNDPAAVRAQVQQGILEAAPAIIAAAESRTISSLRRPRLGGAMQ